MNNAINPISKLPNSVRDALQIIEPFMESLVRADIYPLDTVLIAADYLEEQAKGDDSALIILQYVEWLRTRSSRDDEQNLAMNRAKEQKQ